VVNVSDAAIKQHCALGEVYDHVHFGDRVYALFPFNIHFRCPVAGLRDDSVPQLGATKGRSLLAAYTARSAFVS